MMPAAAATGGCAAAASFRAAAASASAPAVAAARRAAAAPSGRAPMSRHGAASAAASVASRRPGVRCAAAGRGPADASSSTSGTRPGAPSAAPQGELARLVAAELSGEMPDGPALPPAPEGTPGRLEIVVSEREIHLLDVSGAKAALVALLPPPPGEEPRSSTDSAALLERPVGFRLQLPREVGDPRELCELPEVRLWFLRLDAELPWLPVLLDWRAGELARYLAMLLPHQISRTEGIVFNPEALDLAMMGKTFACYEYMRRMGVAAPGPRLKDMAKVLGFTLDGSLFAVLDAGSPKR